MAPSPARCAASATPWTGSASASPWMKASPPPSRKCSSVSHEDGLMYRGSAWVNWGSQANTAISDLEAENARDQAGHGHLRYLAITAPKPAEGQDHLIVATTRPETMLRYRGRGKPGRPRHKALICQHILLPLVNRLIPYVADEHADMEKGTGCEDHPRPTTSTTTRVGKRHNLPMINIHPGRPCVRRGRSGRHPTATPAPPMTPNSLPTEFAGMERFAARKAIVAKLDELGLLAEIRITLQQPYGDRGGVPIEPMLTDQWYVRVAPMAKTAIEAVEDGRIQFVPKQYENMYFSWMRDIQDWSLPSAVGGVTASCLV